MLPSVYYSGFLQRLRRRGGFTLLELMIVVGIMGIVLTMGVPLVYRINHKEPMRKAITEVIEVCSNARAQAILKGVPIDLVFYPREKRANISGSVVSQARTPSPFGDKVLGESVAPPLPPGSGRSFQFHEDINIEMLEREPQGI